MVAAQALPGDSPALPGDHRVVRVAFAVAALEALALGAAAIATSSAAMLAQTAACIADVGVEAFLLIGVARSSLPADARHPLGYGRERFYWALFAAIGLFLSGGGIAVVEAVHALRRPAPSGAYAIGYVVLAATVALDGAALAVALRDQAQRAADRGITLATQLRRGSDPAATTVVVANATGVLGGLLAEGGLAGRQLTGSALPDAIASAVIGIVLVAASVVLLRTNRELLTGRSVPPTMLAAMRAVIAGQAGVVSVPDLFAVLVGPASLMVAGDVTLDDALDIPAVESALAGAGAALRARWPAVTFVYLMPVAEHRPRAVFPPPRRPVRRRPSPRGGPR